jgi:hypothetical protein
MTGVDKTTPERYADDDVTDERPLDRAVKGR